MKAKHKPTGRHILKTKRGYALMSVFGVMMLLSVAAVSYTNRASESLRVANRQAIEIKTSHLCESGVQEVLRTLWRPFKISQSFTSMDALCGGADEEDPKVATSGTHTGIGKYSTAVISYTQPNNDSYTRIVTIRSVGWLDLNNDGELQSDEPRKTIDVTGQFQLARSQVFDYTYFVNNYGWMDGFSSSQLIINGDMRANGNFAFLNGSPTVNGSVYAALNEKLDPPAQGTINTAPVKWDDTTYTNNYNNTGTAYRERWRSPYNSTNHGAKGSSAYEENRDFVFESQGGLLGSKPYGAVMADSTGYKSWTRTATGNTPTYTVLDTNPTEEVIMPDLSNLSYYQNLSQTYVDTKQTFADGTANPGFGQGAYVDVWDQTLNGGAGAYKRVSNNGVVTGTAILIGTSAKPIRIHGPVTFTEDAVVKGHVAGQGTMYTGRNAHIVGSIRYSDQDLNGNVVGTPNFLGSSPAAIDAANEKRSMLGIASRGSVIMGNTTTFTNSYPLYYMRPPFTKGRYDEYGNYIPPYDATQVDYTGRMRYQSTISDAQMNSVSESINVLDCVLYTNFVGGGNIGTGGGGVTFNGTIISKDEAMVVWSLPMRMNYDNRIRERNMTRTPLIDLQLPRSPVMLRSSWQDYGFSMHRGAGNAITSLGNSAGNIVGNSGNHYGQTNNGNNGEGNNNEGDND